MKYNKSFYHCPYTSIMCVAMIFGYDFLTLHFHLPPTSLLLLLLSLCLRCYAVWLNGETFEVVVSEPAALLSFLYLCLALPLSLTVGEDCDSCTACDDHH